MANYAKFQEAIDSGITNMTILRNHSRNDDSTSTYATGIDWFKFNGTIVSNIYSSGNSWLGFGSNSEQLKVNRRDCAVWDEYKETGVIGLNKFFKFRWQGTSVYSGSYEHTDSYQQYFEVFLFDTGQIFLNFFKVPTSSLNGTNQLVCGSQSLSFAVSSGTPIEYTFTPGNVSTGTNWTVVRGRPDIDKQYKSNGYAVFTINDYLSKGNDRLFWESEEPTGTDIKIYSKINNNEYIEIHTSGDRIQNIPNEECTLIIKVELSTENVDYTPVIRSLIIKGDDDFKKLILESGIPNIRSAVSFAYVSYDGEGTLSGDGGPVESFDESLDISIMNYRPNPNDPEHFEFSADCSIVLAEIIRSSYRSSGFEHFEFSDASCSTSMTHIRDL